MRFLSIPLFPLLVFPQLPPPSEQSVITTVLRDLQPVSCISDQQSFFISPTEFPWFLAFPHPLLLTPLRRSSCLPDPLLLSIHSILFSILLS